MLLTWPVIGWPMEARAQPMMCRLDALAPLQSHTLGESKNHRQEIVLRLLQEPTLVDPFLSRGFLQMDQTHWPQRC